MKRKNKLMLGLLSGMLCLTASPISVFAEGDTTAKTEDETDSITYRSNETGKITVKYYDDATQKTPTVGSKWRLYKVADVTYTNAEMTIDGLEITSLIDGLDITASTTAEDVEKKIEYTTVSESKITLTGKDTNGKELKYVEGTTDKNGSIVFDNLEQGVYFGIEVESPDDHNRSTPFLVSIPNTDETGKVSSLEATIEPKAVLAGDLTVDKELHGNATDAAHQWTMELTLPEGTYHYSTTATSRGKAQDGYCKNGDKIKIYAGETLSVDNIPAGSDYKITESEANANGYSTKYDNQSGKVEAYKDINVKVHNTKNKDVKTSTGSNTLMYVGIGTIAGALLIVILASKSKNKKEN